MHAARVGAFDRGEVGLPLRTFVRARQGRFDYVPSRRANRRRERRVHRRLDEHTRPRRRPGAEQSRNPGNDVGDQVHVAGRDPPAPARLRPRREGFAEPARERVPRVVVVDGPLHRLGDRHGEREVHLRDPGRQDVGWVQAPLCALAPPQRCLRDAIERVRGGRVGHARQYRRRQGSPRAKRENPWLRRSATKQNEQYGLSPGADPSRRNAWSAWLPPWPRQPRGGSGTSLDVVRW